MQKVMIDKLNGYFLIQNNNLLEKHNTVWDKVSANMKIYCDSQPVYKK